MSVGTLGLEVLGARSRVTSPAPRADDVGHEEADERADDEREDDGEDDGHRHVAGRVLQALVARLHRA